MARGGGTGGAGRITRSSQYAMVYAKGGRRSCDLLVMRSLPNGLEQSRYGFSISKGVGNAVVRNRIRRRLREIMRAAAIEPGWDIVLIARPAAATADYAGLRHAVAALLARAHLIEAASVVV